MCRLCATEVGMVQHVLSGCKVALEQGSYTWRHDKVLIPIRSKVAYHLDNRVNNPKRPVSTQERVLLEQVLKGRKCLTVCTDRV